jgi:hypothetical protein
MHYLSVKSMACSYNMDQIPPLLINNGINLLLMPDALIEYFFHIVSCIYTVRIMLHFWLVVYHSFKYL